MARSSSKADKKKDAAKAPDLSAEYIYDSDEPTPKQSSQAEKTKQPRSREAADKTAKSLKQAASKKTAPPKPSKDVAGKKKSAQSKPQSKESKKAKAPKPSSGLAFTNVASDQSDEESESSSGSDAEVAPQPQVSKAVKQKTAAKAKAAEPESSDSEEAASRAASSDSDSDGDEPSRNGTSGDHEMKDASSADSESENVEPPAENEASTEPEAKVPDFKPYGGFTPVHTMESSKEITKHLAAKGKQIWHITAPAALPIEAVHSALLRKDEKSSRMRLDSEKTVASHVGVEYRFVEGPSDVSRRVYVPDEDTGTFTLARNPVAKLIHIRQKLTPPSFLLGKDTGSASQSAAAPARPRPEQPVGLRIRYQPYGVEGQEPAIGSRIGQPGIYSRRDEVALPKSPDEDVASPTKKRKKAAPPEGSSPMPEQLALRKKRRKENGTPAIVSQANGHTETNNSQGDIVMVPDSQPDGLTDKQRRKAEKRARKEAETAEAEINEVSADVHEEPSQEGAAADQDEAGAHAETPEERARRKAEKKRRKEKRAQREAGPEA